jgi:Fructose-bisphosphate aldolase class-I
VSIPCGPSALAVKEAAWGLARYAAIAQVHIVVVTDCFSHGRI